jgi:hypothetical protein
MSPSAVLAALPANIWNLATRSGDSAEDVHSTVTNLYFARKIIPKVAGADIKDFDTVWTKRM